MKIISVLRRNYENHAASVGHIYKNTSNSSDNKMSKWFQYPQPTKKLFCKYIHFTSIPWRLLTYSCPESTVS